MFIQGGVYEFAYLWRREHEAGEESGRKNRPVCLVFRSANGRLFILPITTRSPRPDRVFLQIPSKELKQAGLPTRSWIILDEFNSTFENRAYDFASIDPIGRFSAEFLTLLRACLNELIKARRAHNVPRS